LAGVDYNEIEEVFHLREIDVSIAFSKKTSDSIVQKVEKLLLTKCSLMEPIMQIRSKMEMLNNETNHLGSMGMRV